MQNNIQLSNDRVGFASAVETLAVYFALSGGFLLLCVVFINVLSTVGSIFLKPFPGDFELTEMGVAVAVFSFLPYCQLTGANVTADIFTSRASSQWIARFKLLASIVATGLALLLIWRMSDGMMSQLQYRYTTTILQIPIWYAYIPAIASLILLAAVSLLTMIEIIVKPPFYRE